MTKMRISGGGTINLIRQQLTISEQDLAQTVTDLCHRVLKFTKKNHRSDQVKDSES